MESIFATDSYLAEEDVAYSAKQAISFRQLLKQYHQLPSDPVNPDWFNVTVTPMLWLAQESKEAGKHQAHLAGLKGFSSPEWKYVRNAVKAKASDIGGVLDKVAKLSKQRGVLFNKENVDLLVRYLHRVDEHRKTPHGSVDVGGISELDVSREFFSALSSGITNTYHGYEKDLRDLALDFRFDWSLLIEKVHTQGMLEGQAHGEKSE